MSLILKCRKLIIVWRHPIERLMSLFRCVETNGHLKKELDIKKDKIDSKLFESHLVAFYNDRKPHIGQVFPRLSGFLRRISRDFPISFVSLDHLSSLLKAAQVHFSLPAVQTHWNSSEKRRYQPSERVKRLYSKDMAFHSKILERLSRKPFVLWEEAIAIERYDSIDRCVT